MKSLRSFLKTDPAVLAIALLSIAAHLFVIDNLEYHRDELLYFSLGQHPAAGYVSVPPLIAWVAFVMQKLFGISLFSVRIFPALMCAVTIMICASLARRMGGSRYAAILAATGLMVSVFFMRTFSMFQPVFMEIFLWTVILYFIVLYVNDNSGKYLLLLGAAVGIALLNKYLAALLLISVLVTVPFTPHRSIFKNKSFWYGAGLAFIIFLPNLLWQLSRGLPVFHHLTELHDTQLVHMNAALFLKEQVMMPFAGSVMSLAGLVWLLTGPAARKFRFMGVIAVIVIMALMLLKGKSYYTLGVFPFLITAGAVAWDKWLGSAAARIILPLVMVLLTIPVLPLQMAWMGKEGLKDYFRGMEQLTGMAEGRRFEDGSVQSLPQDYADMIGWEELTSIVAGTYKSVADKSGCIIYCENYGQAGAITVIGKKYGLPEAVSFGESFRYWFPEAFNPDIKTLIYVNDEPGEDVRSLFGKIEKTGSIKDSDAREYGTSVFLCSEPRESFNRFWQLRTSEILKERQNKWFLR